MTRLQKLQLRQSELRTEIGTLLDKDASERTDEERSKLDAASKEMRALEGDIQAALLIEDEPKADPTSGDAERRELSELESRSSVLPFLVEAATGAPATGAEHKYRAGILGDDARPGLLPIEKVYREGVRDILAVAGDYKRGLASARRGTLALEETPDGLKVEIAREALDTPVGRELVAQSENVPIYARPIIDPTDAQFVERDGVPVSPPSSPPRRATGPPMSTPSPRRRLQRDCGGAPSLPPASSPTPSPPGRSLRPRWSWSAASWSGRARRCSCSRCGAGPWN